MSFDREAMLTRLNGSHANGVAKQAERPKRKTPGWWNVLAAFVDERLATVSPLAGCVWFVLFRNSRDGIACVSHARLATTIGMSERSIRYAIEELTEARFIHIESRGGRVKGPTRYRLIGGNGLPVMSGIGGNGLPTVTGNGLPTFHTYSTPDAAVASPATGGDR